MAGKFKDYILGSGELWFAKSLVQGAAPSPNVPFRYLGNTPELSQAQAVTKLEHKDADHGIQYTDDSVVTDLARTGKIKADSNDIENLAMFFLTENTVYSQASTVGISEAFTISPGQSVQLGTSVNASGLRSIENVAVNNTATPATVYAAGTDYVVDPDLGWLKIPAGSTIPAETGITVTFDSTEGTRVQVVTTQNAVVEGALKFVSYNAKGTKYDYLWPYVSVTPDGDFTMKGTTWQEMNFTFDILTPGDGRAAMYLDGRPQSI